MIRKIEKKLAELEALRPFRPNPSSKKKCLESRRFIVKGLRYQFIRFSKRCWIAETDGSYDPNFIDKKSEQKAIFEALEKGDFKFTYSW